MLEGHYKAVGPLKPLFVYRFVIISVEKHNDNLFWFDLLPNNEQKFVSIYLIKDEKNVIIETGPACSIDNLVKGIKEIGLDLLDIDYIIPTHIHLDHFGGGGHIMELCSNAKTVLHPKACTHVSRIEDWWAGSKDFLGEVADFYGKPIPISSSRVISAKDGFEVSLGKRKLKALHTPGHAPHHISWIYEDEAFVGDSLGLWYPKLGTSFPVTPGYYRHDLALESIEKLASLNLNYFHYTHFGPRLAKGIAQKTKKEFVRWMSLIEQGFQNKLSSIEILKLLFASSPDLKQTDENHGIHQRTTHLGSVEGMLNWQRRLHAKN